MRWPNWPEVRPLVPALSTLILIGLAPHISGEPRFVQAGLLFLSFQGLLCDRRAGEHPPRSSYVLVVAGLLLVPGMPYYFSDDALRHAFDGSQLLRGNDVYRFAPLELGASPGLPLPNHAQLATIYLPFTQIQAVLGALFSERYGYSIVYATLCVLLIVGTTRRLSPGGAIGSFRGVLLAPAFWLMASGRHADLQGALIVTWLLAGWLRKSQPAKSVCALEGLLCAALVGIKPEGAIWCAGLLGLHMRKWKANPGGSTTAVCHLLGLAYGLAIQSVFALFVMFPRMESVSSFLDTARLFADWFVAYNPIIGLLEGADIDSRPEMMHGYRLGILAVVVIAFLCVPVALRFGRVARGIQRSDWWLMLLIGALAFSVFARGSWNPWYFAWFFPLGLLAPSRVARVASHALPLFYLPVADLRAGGDWDMRLFYVSIASYFFAWILLTAWRRRGSVRAWKREGRSASEK
ncbi:MAG: hypothetical protein H7A21_05390 [Spirochaetales bacterium]|nr:hypothetical protein [Leptospiraceae bacterium]MCP5480849.1 hypothetical protein [Spirochaetales bacterium]